MTTKIICAWCGKKMGEKEEKVGGGVTHSICPRCLKEQKKIIQATRRKIRATQR